MKSPIALLSCLLDDFKRLEPGVKHLDRDLKTIEARFKHEGYGFLTVTLPSLCDALDQGLVLGRFTCPTAFSRRRGEALPKFLKGLLCNVFDTKTGLLEETPSIGSLKCLREILRLFKKLPLSGERENDLDRAARDEFRRCDESIASVKIDARHVHHLARVCSLTLNQLEGADYEQLDYKHGPGAVYEGFTPNQKWFDVDRARGTRYQEYWDPLMDLSLSCKTYGELQESNDPGAFHRVSHGGWVYKADQPTYTRHCYSGDRPRTDKHRELLTEKFIGNHRVLESVPEVKCLNPNRISKLLTVPKTSTARRTITSEPCLAQYAQQGLNALLRSNILRCDVLQNCLDLTDQSLNQKLALEGSRSGYWATIDLSSASDLLSLELVKIVFGSKPLFLERLIESRSTHVKDGKTIYEMRKYAGMGNATTFPVQSVVFACIAIAAILDCESTYFSKEKVKRAARLVRVYGDDIIVPSRYSRQVVDWLTACGLRVNSRKSFMEDTAGRPCFRESCGIDAYDGKDITPLYLRAMPEKSSTEPSAIASLVSTSNSLWERGLYSASAYLSELVEAILKRKLPLVPKRSSALGWHTRIDACNPTKWDPTLQRLCFKAPVLRPTYRSDRLDGYAALLKFFFVPLLGRGAKHLERTQVRFKVDLTWKWLPAECG